MNISNVKYGHPMIVIIMIVLSSVVAKATTLWTVNPSDYQYDMTLYLDVKKNGERLDYSQYEVGVFCGDECRGVAKELPLGSGKSCLYMRARSNKASGETMTFRYHDKATMEVYVIGGAQFIFESNGLLGYPSNPYIVGYEENFDVTIIAGIGGTVNLPGGTYPYGTELELMASPVEGYHFKGWSDGMTENPRLLTVDNNRTLYAEFAPNVYTLTLYLNNEVYSVEELEFNTPISVKNPEIPEGCEFEGWLTEIPETMPPYDLDIYGTYSDMSSVASVVIDSEEMVSVCTMYGAVICNDKKWSEIVSMLESGIYIVNGKKIWIRK